MDDEYTQIASASFSFTKKELLEELAKPQPMEAQPHTFEWALPHMKAGKKVRLGQDMWEQRPTGFYVSPLVEAGQPPGFWFPGRPKPEALLADGWSRL